MLIGGETGNGKELAARALHSRARAPPVRSWPSTARRCRRSWSRASSSGAFAGPSRARSRPAGLFDAARGGTLLLDEIGELSRGVQAKLLRVLEAGSYRPLGAVREKPLEARVLAATNRDLARLCADGEFRLDLYYRVAVLRIVLPPLRERRADIPALVAALRRARRPPGAAIAPRRWGGCSRTPGPATCASCAAWSSARCCAPNKT